MWEDEYEEGVFFHDRKNDADIAYYKIYMDLGFDHNPLYESEVISAGYLCIEKWSKHYLFHKRTMYCDSLGLDHKYDLLGKETDKAKWLAAIPNAVKMHTAFGNEKAEEVYRRNVQRMCEIAKLCDDRGIELYIVIPPIYKKYYESVDAVQLQRRYATIRDVAEKWDNVSWDDYFKDARFVEDDFFDGNHLTSDVDAVKFAEILYEDIWSEAK